MLGDIRDPEHVAASVEGVDVVLHLAALIAIPFSYVAPRSYVETNVIGTLNVLEGVRRHGTPRMVNTSTSEVYGTPEHVPITEEHPLRGQSPYSATKIGADKMCESYALSFGTPVITLRPFNTFGPRQSARAVIPTVLSQLLAGADEVRLGDVTPKRDFTFVTDTADGFVRAAVADLEPGATIQLGTGRTVSVGEVVELCRAVTGSSARIVTDEARIRPEGSEVQVLLSDPSRAAAELGWRADASPSRTASRRRPSGCGRGSTPPPPGATTDERHRGETHAPGARGPEGTIPLAVPNIGELEREYVVRAVESGFVSSVGPFVAEFEEAFARRVGARYAVACSSGTAALHVAFLVLGVGPGDEVLCSDFTFVGSANPIAYPGARPVLVDSERATWNLDPALVAAELDRRAAAGERQPAARRGRARARAARRSGAHPRGVRPPRGAGRRGRRRVARGRVVGGGRWPAFRPGWSDGSGRSRSTATRSRRPAVAAWSSPTTTTSRPGRAT